jgi:hypothetical protein
MNKRYIVGSTCGSENGVRVAPYFVVGIDHDQATRILSWMDKFEQGGALRDAAFVEFWDSSCVFLDDSCAGVISDEQLDELFDGKANEKRFVLTKEQFARDPDALVSEDDGFVRTEGDLEVIWTGHACFRGWISGTDDLIETTSLPRELIEQIARETASTNQTGEAS